MSLQDSIEAITDNLRSGSYQNEQAISQCVVIRLLHELGWDTYNPGHVWREYSVGDGRVEGRADLALCFPARKPAIFIEVKQPGRVEGADKQLFEYAFHNGVPMAILCDGKTWTFYLPAGQGPYDERRVYKLDLYEHTSEKAAEIFTRYLNFKRTVSGEAIKAAQIDYGDRKRSALARETIPEAWKDLVEGKEPSLLDRLATEVETKCGVKPETVDIVAFLKTLRTVSDVHLPPPPEEGTRVVVNRDENKPAKFTKFIVTLNGKASQPLSKNRSILEVARYLVQNGVAPEKIQEIHSRVPGIKYIPCFQPVPGNCNAKDGPERIHQITRREISDIRKRWFFGTDEILHYKDQTYFFSTQWEGEQMLKTFQALANAFSQHKITIASVSGAE